MKRCGWVDCWLGLIEVYQVEDWFAVDFQTELVEASFPQLAEHGVHWQA